MDDMQEQVQQHLEFPWGTAHSWDGSTPASREALIEIARTYLGTPFKHMGRQRNRGVDCVGLPICVAQEGGYLKTWREVDYARLFESESLQRIVSQYCKPVEDIISAADLILFNITGRVTHVGLYTGRGTVIHADERRGAVVEHSLSGRWLEKVSDFYRLKEL